MLHNIIYSNLSNLCFVCGPVNLVAVNIEYRNSNSTFGVPGRVETTVYVYV